MTFNAYGQLISNKWGQNIQKEETPSGVYLH